MRLKFERKLSYHLIRTYLPSGLFVTLAWFSMFIPIEHVPGEWTGIVLYLIGTSSPRFMPEQIYFRDVFLLLIDYLFCSEIIGMRIVVIPAKHVK